MLQVEAENLCTSQMRLLIDQISEQTGKILTLEGAHLVCYHNLQYK